MPLFSLQFLKKRLAQGSLAGLNFIHHSTGVLHLRNKVLVHLFKENLIRRLLVLGIPLPQANTIADRTIEPQPDGTTIVSHILRGFFPTL